MQLKNLLALVLAGQAAARNLSEALASQNSSLSALNGLILSSPSILSAFESTSNITVLAPDNHAIQKFLDESPLGSISRYGPEALAALLRYHVLNGTYYASNISSANHPLFIPTALTDTSYANITGGQRVEATTVDGNVTFYSGLGNKSTVVKPDTNFTGGTLHIISQVFTIPENDTRTLIVSKLTAAAGALEATDLADTIEAEADVTIFAPTNEAFCAVGSAVGNLTGGELAKLMRYHVVTGTTSYGSELMNGTLKTLGGGDVTITVLNGTVFVNSARVVHSDLLVDNGVVHVIDNVLNPMNTTASPNASATSDPAAFCSGSSTGGVPFTWGPVASTATVSGATAATSGSSSSSSGPAVPVRTGAVGAAALFGGAAVLANL